MINYLDFMNIAIEKAKIGLKTGGIPIGAILVLHDNIIGVGRNRRVQKDNPILHAEMDCLQNVGRLKHYQDTILFTTLMPCYMCSGAIVQFGIKTVIVGESETFVGDKKFLTQHGVEVIDLNLTECKTMMTKFIINNEDLWNEDIGESK